MGKMILTTLVSLALAGVPQGDHLDATAHVLTPTLAVGSEAAFVVEIESTRPIDASWETTTDHAHAAGLRKPVLQLEVPESIELLDSYKPEEERTSRQDWLDFYFDRPYGRLVDANRIEIPFRVVSEPGTDDEIGINLVTYTEEKDPKSARLVRLRLQLEVAGGAKARRVTADRSSWGTRTRLHIGDRASDFELPSGWGETVRLSNFLGSGKPIFVMTYRSDW